MDITGATIKWVMQQGERSASADVEKPSADGSLTITDVTIGTFSIVIEAGDTLSLQPGPYCHEADIINVSGEPFPVTIGKAVLNDAAASISS